MTTQRRDILKYSLAAAAASALPAVQAQVPAAPGTGSGTAAGPGIDPRDRVFITNEDSNTLVVIDPKTNTVESTINLTSFDEDPRPPFRYVTAGVAPTHDKSGMVSRALCMALGVRRMASTVASNRNDHEGRAGPRPSRDQAVDNIAPRKRSPKRNMSMFILLGATSPPFVIGPHQQHPDWLLGWCRQELAAYLAAAGSAGAGREVVSG